MSSPRVVEEKISEGGLTFSAALFEVENAILIIISEGDVLRLGTLAVALPSERIPSSVLLGERAAMTIRLLAEHVATHCQKITLVSGFVRKMDDVVGSALAKLVRKLLSRR